MKYFYDTRKDSYRFAEESVNYFINVGLQVTRRCNLKCVYCCEAGTMIDASVNQIKKMIDKLVINGLKRICLTGGEPLLRKDLEKIARYIKKKGVFVTLSTNGMNLTKERLKKLIPYIDNIRLSLRGPKKIHNEITGDELSFDKTIEAIRISRDCGLPISVVVTVLDKNFEYMEDLARLCEKEGVDKLYYFTLIPRGRAMKIGNQAIAVDKISREYNRIAEIAREKDWNLDIKMANFSIEGECILIFPNGDVVGVPSFTHKGNQMVLGNLLKENPMELWKKFPFKENYINYYWNH